MEEKKIIVIYVGIAGIRTEDVDTYVKSVAERISPKSIDAEILTIPSQSNITRVECVNPQYITNDFLIKKHEFLMKELHEKLEEQIKFLENEKKESRD